MSEFPIGRCRADFIGELCIALEHSWKPSELFLIFTSYFDETDTHGPTPDIIMAGYLGHAYQWRRFDRKLRDLQTDHGFKILHASHFKSKTGEFDGWSDDECMDLVRDFTNLVKNNLTAGLAVALEHNRYISEYRAGAPARFHLDSQYGLCFRACLAHLIDRMEVTGQATSKQTHISATRKRKAQAGS
jgi:hypothetical protein